MSQSSPWYPGRKKGRQRVLVCGDRNWTDFEIILESLRDARPLVVIEGEARGADQLARRAADQLGIPVLRFPANWARYKRAAGPIRNRQMLKEGQPTEVWAFHDNLTTSKGTWNMIRLARKKIRVLHYSHTHGWQD